MKGSQEGLYAKYFSTHYARMYGTVTLNEIRARFAAWNGFFGKLLPRDVHAKILDAGCGIGDFLFWLKDVGFHNLRGVDISADQIQAGKRLGFSDLFEGNIFEEFSNNIGYYDVIFARDILEHFGKEDAVNFCALAARSLANGGMLVIQTINAENLMWGRLRHGDFTHEQAFTENSIRQLLSFVGFEHVSVFPQRPVVHGVKSLVRYIWWMSFEFLQRLYLLAETGSSSGIFTQNLLIVAKK